MILVFSTSDRWVSRMIRKITNTEVSHVGFLTIAADQSVVLHADVGGVQFTPLARFLVSNSVIAAFERTTCTTRDEACSFAKAMEMLGDSYDYPSLVMRALVHTARWLGIKIRNPLRSPRSVVCSEFVARSVSDFAAYDPEEVEPGELLSHCQNSDSWREYSFRHSLNS